MKALRIDSGVLAAVLGFAGLTGPVFGQVTLVSVSHINNGGTASGIAIAQGISDEQAKALIGVSL